MVGAYKKALETEGAEAALEKFQRCYRRKLHGIGVEPVRAGQNCRVRDICRDMKCDRPPACRHAHRRL